MTPLAVYVVEIQTGENRITEKSQWLSLRDACRLLDVSNTTLRQWADNGYLRVYRTPVSYTHLRAHET